MPTAEHSHAVVLCPTWIAEHSLFVYSVAWCVKCPLAHQHTPWCLFRMTQIGRAEADSQTANRLDRRAASYWPARIAQSQFVPLQTKRKLRAHHIFLSSLVLLSPSSCWLSAVMHSPTTHTLSVRQRVLAHAFNFTAARGCFPGSGCTKKLSWTL